MPVIETDNFPEAATNDVGSTKALLDSDNAPPDLTQCDLEPITRLERIQSFGFLIAVTNDWTVTRVSSNLKAMTGIDPVAALGTALDLWVDAEVLHDIRNCLSGLAGSRGIERIYGVALIAGRAAFDIAVHYADRLCILEGERAGLDDRIDAASLVRKMVARLSTRPTMDEFHRDAARQVRIMTSFDRVMIYRFASNGDGEVIAEAARPGMETLLGLHYPAADIPVQARALYLLNTFRIIADVRSATVPLLAPAGAATEPLNLSQAMTRAVSPVHIEYLSNMGVGASASISIVVDGKLWGLIVCHNETPCLPTFIIRTAAELFGQMYSMTLESRLRQSADHHDRLARDAVSRMMAAIATNDALLRDPGWLQDVTLEMVRCDGIAIVLNGAASTNGATPTAGDIETLVKVIDSASPDKVFVSDNLASLHADFGRQPQAAAGVLAIPISRESSNYILFFRREQLQDVKWAGEPLKNAGGGATERISPRKSFAAFTQLVRGTAVPFTSAEQRLAEMIRSSIIEIILRGEQLTQAEQKRTAGRQEILIAELNHRVRNVLSLIRGLISQTLGEAGESAKYVDSLNGRVQALARAHDRVTRQNWGPGPLNAIFDDEINAYVPTQRERFVILGPFIMLQPQAYSTLALIVHELVTNSLKYGALSDNGSVQVSLRVVQGEGLYFNWAEVGGPPVAVPTRRGFGSVIIERVVPFDLRGTATVSYLPTGLEAEFMIPERYLAASDQASITVSAPAPPAPTVTPVASIKRHPLDGLNVLLLEDNLIVALEAEDLLRGLGAASVALVSSTAAAANIHNTSRVDFAVLDINLGFESSFSFAATLRSARIPFIFASGYGEPRGDALQLLEPTVTKPYDRDYLNVAIEKTLAQNRGAQA